MTMMPQEQQVRQLVRETLTQVGQIDNGRLAQLMPAIPKKKRPFWHNPAVPQTMRQAAMAAMMFILLLGSWQWFSHSSSAIWSPAATAVAVTATMTHTPTATQTQQVPTETAVARELSPEFIYTPAPLPTPVAAVPINTN